MNDRVHDLEFERLLSRLLEGGLNDTELQHLGELMETQPALRSRYLDFCQIHALLRAEHGLLASWEPAEATTTGQSYRRRWLRKQPFAFSAIAVALAGVALIGVWNFLPTDPEAPFRGEPMAELLREVGLRFAYGAHGEPRTSEGTALPQGRYELEQGIIEVGFESGAVLTFEAPASFTIIDERHVQIEDGKLAAHVPEQAKGFRVDAPGATVVDLGTDFAVEARKQEDSEVHVFNGEVQIDLHGSKVTDANPLMLTTGEAARIDYLTGIPAGIDLDEQRFLRRLDLKPRVYAQRVLQLDPVVYYPMEPASDGVFLADASGHGTDAVIHFGRASAPVWAAGKVGLALELGGPAQQSYASAAKYPQAEGDELSVIAWVRADARPRWASIAKNWAGADDRGQFHFGLYWDSGELEAHIQDSSRNEITVKDSVPLPLRKWHHVAFVADGSVLRLYRNGEQVDAAPYERLRRDPRIKALAIGTKLNLQGDAPEERDFNMWDGRLDEIAIFNHALSPDQVRELYELVNGIH
jgi:Concanavalin A-like lectin/glucanases superfamily/FecR protein